MGLSIPPILSVVLVLLFVCIIILSLILWKQEKKLRQFMAGKDAKSLETTLAWLTEKTARTDEVLNAHKEALEFIDKRVKKSLRGYSLVRYNAYEQGGNDQSFASGLLDEGGNGYVLSVITNRNHVGVYAKPIKNFSSDITLTDEEKLAVKLSQKSL